MHPPTQGAHSTDTATSPPSASSSPSAAAAHDDDDARHPPALSQAQAHVTRLRPTPARADSTENTSLLRRASPGSGAEVDDYGGAGAPSSLGSASMSSSSASPKKRRPHLEHHSDDPEEPESAIEEEAQETSALLADERSDDGAEEDADADGEGDDEVAMSLSDAHAGVAAVEGAQQVASRSTESRWLLFLGLGLASYIYSLDSTTTYNYLPFAASAFGAHARVGALQVTQSVVVAVGKPVIAKVADVSSRGTAYAVVLAFYVAGYAVIATAGGMTAVACGLVLYAVGYTGLQLLTQIVIADMTSLRWRGLVGALASAPFLLNAWAGAALASRVLAPDGPGWRFGYLMFALLVPLALSPLVLTLLWAERKARQLGLVQRTLRISTAADGGYARASASFDVHAYSHPPRRSSVSYDPRTSLSSSHASHPFSRPRAPSTALRPLSMPVPLPSGTPQRSPDETPLSPLSASRRRQRSISAAGTYNAKASSKFDDPKSWRGRASKAAEQMDLVGLILLGGSVSLVLLPMTLSGGGGGARWNSPLGLALTFATGCALLAAFLWWDLRHATRPVVPKRLIMDRTVAGATLVGAFDFMTFYITFTYLFSYALVVKPWSIQTTSYFVQTQTVALTLFALVAGWVMKAIRRYKRLLIVGLVLRLGGVALMLHARSAIATGFALVLAQALQGAGGGLATAAAQVGAQAAVPHADVAVVIALVLLLAEVGAAAGGAIAGAIWAHTMPGNLERHLPGVSLEERQELFGSVEYARQFKYGTPVRNGVIQAYDDTMRVMVLTALVLSIVPLLIAFVMPDWYLCDQQNNVDGGGSAVDEETGGEV